MFECEESAYKHWITRPQEVLVSQRSRKAFHAMECRTKWLRYFDE